MCQANLLFKVALKPFTVYKVVRIVNAIELGKKEYRSEVPPNMRSVWGWDINRFLKLDYDEHYHNKGSDLVYHPGEMVVAPKAPGIFAFRYESEAYSHANRMHWAQMGILELTIPAGARYREALSPKYHFESVTASKVLVGRLLSLV